MTACFATYENKELPEKTYTDVIAIWFDDQTWTIKIKTRNGKITYKYLNLDDYCISYVHI